MELLVGESPAIHAMRTRIQAASRISGSVLIVGETGTGKELVARSIHDLSGVRGRFVAVDCGAMPDDLIESELFGHRKGAFTTAFADKPGLIETAHQGTLFLDEIGNTSTRFQVKLLRVLQDKQVRRVGDVEARGIELRIIAATNADLGSMVRNKAFREDLFYRLNVFTIQVPPLRRRPGDVSLLARALVSRLNTRHRLSKELTADAVRRLETYSFPGNVRELENVIESAYFLADRGDIGEEHIQFPYEDMPGAPPDELLTGNFWDNVARPYSDRLITRTQVEHLIRRGLERSGGSYRRLLHILHLPETDYKRFMDFLRRHHCNVDFREYRKRGTESDG